MSLENKIDFAIIFSVRNANPNGDPLNGNRPRVDYDGFGEITDVCLKRKIRDRLQSEGYSIFVQSDEKKTDGMTSLKNRAEHQEHGLGKDAFNTKMTPMERLLNRLVKNGLMCGRLDSYLRLKAIVKMACRSQFVDRLVFSQHLVCLLSVSPVHKLLRALVEKAKVTRKALTQWV